MTGADAKNRIISLTLTDEATLQRSGNKLCHQHKNGPVASLPVASLPVTIGSVVDPVAIAAQIKHMLIIFDLANPAGCATYKACFARWFLQTDAHVPVPLCIAPETHGLLSLLAGPVVPMCKVVKATTSTVYLYMADNFNRTWWQQFWNEAFGMTP